MDNSPSIDNVICALVTLKLLETRAGDPPVKTEVYTCRLSGRSVNRLCVHVNYSFVHSLERILFSFIYLSDMKLYKLLRLNSCR
jgi:hypothetical protein